VKGELFLMRKQYTPTSYRRAALDGRYDAIVAGSGAGGLAAAVLLAKDAGKRILILEQHYTAGGFTHVFSRTGFEWDVGLHYIGDVQHPDSGTRRIFDHLTDGRLQWADMPYIYDRVIMPDRSFDFPTGVERFRERMHSYFPREAHAIDRYISAVNRAAARMGLLRGNKIYCSEECQEKSKQYRRKLKRSGLSRRRPVSYRRVFLSSISSSLDHGDMHSNHGGESLVGTVL
jgi:phytoene dehydrogenase-like protein